MDYLGEMAKLKQEEHAFEEYQEEFIRLPHQVQLTSQEFLVSCCCFINSLRESVSARIIVQKIQFCA